MSDTRFSIPLGQLAEQMKEGLEQKVRAITLTAFSRVVLRSPVSTGRFRANWNVSYGSPNYSTTDSTDQARGPHEAQKSLTLPVGGLVYLSNGLPYAQRLEVGYSKQAPQGMIRLTALEISQAFNGNAQ
jgi:hypothetical protein